MKFIKNFTLFFIFLSIISFITFRILDTYFPLDLKRFEDHSPLFEDVNSKLIHCLKTNDDQWRIPIDINKIDQNYLNYLIEKEDKNFYTHYGVDFKAIIRAIFQNITKGKIFSGASTLTMQTARLLEPRPRTYVSKLIEVFRSFQLEYHYSKKEILKFYVNLVPFGGNLEGVRTASLAYFKKEPDRLLISEIALLISIPQSPTRLRPDRYPDLALRKRNQTLDIFHQKNFLDEDTYLAAIQDKIPSKRHIFPNLIPHLAYSLRDETKIIKTTLNKQIQEKLIHLLKETSQNIPKNANACAIIHNHQKNEIVAYVGSTDFFNKDRLGQNDFCQAIRSPGSTLKPLIFGLAFDEGLIEPETLFHDERKHFGAYAPHNFDRAYHGIMSASETLQLSLNIPSVELLNLLGPIRFYAALKAIGVNPEFQSKDVKPNLSMALGGVGLKLVDLVKIFSTFATEGQAFDIHYVQNQTAAAPKFLLYPSSAIKVKEILEKNPFSFLNNHKIALKTGTSYGYRDALALAFNDQYTIGVWVGTPKEGSLNEKTGFELAVPILRQVLDILPKSDNHLSNMSINEIPNTFKLKPLLKQHVLVSKKEVIATKFEMSFPQKDSLLMITKGDMVPIRFKGGQKPYRLYVNNSLEYIDVFQKKITFLPKNEGFYTLTLQDKNGDYDSVNIEIRWNQ